MVFKTEVKHSVKKLRKKGKHFIIIFQAKKLFFFYCQRCCYEWSTVQTKAKPICFLLAIAVNPCEQTVDCGNVLSLWEIHNQVYTLEMTGFFLEVLQNSSKCDHTFRFRDLNKTKTLLKFARNLVCTVLAKKLNDALNCVTCAISVLSNQTIFICWVLKQMKEKEL